ncbi:MAG: hypothetical protein ACK4M3_03345 [Pyrobaculum sp.]
MKRWYLLLAALALLLLSPTLFLLFLLAFLAYIAVRQIPSLLARHNLKRYLREMEEVLRDLATEGKARFIAKRGRAYILAPAGERTYLLLPPPTEAIRPRFVFTKKAYVIDPLEAELYRHLVKTRLAKSVRIISRRKTVVIEIYSPKTKTPPTYIEVIGTVEAAIAAAITAVATGKTVEIVEEEEGKGKRVVILTTETA